MHSDSEILKALNLQHLKAHLRGEAAELLENVPIADAVYDGAWLDLVNMYENSHLLLFGYIRCVVKYRPQRPSLPQLNWSGFHSFFIILFAK